MNWKTILVPHDFSSSANHALAIARDEAKTHGAQVMLLHVIDLPSQFKPEMVVVPESTGAPMNVKDFAVQQAEQHLADLSSRLAKDGVTAQTFIRIGKPEDEIVRFATENSVDLIAMGTHGRTGLAHMLVGSVAERVVRTAKVPVLTIRSDHS
jgi:nucleotide-binding universal stress UspA family protein